MTILRIGKKVNRFGFTTPFWVIDTHLQQGPKRAGFTLLEVIAILVIISIFFTLSIPLFSKFMEGAKLSMSARNVASVCRVARAYAITNNIDCYVVFVTPNEYFDSADQANPIEKKYRLPAGIRFYKPGASDPIDEAVEFTNDIACFKPTGELDETASRSVYLADDTTSTANSKEVNVEHTTGRVKIK